MIDSTAATFGLPPCLQIPIAAVDVEAIRTHVGQILKTIVGHNKRINAVLVESYDHIFHKTPGVKLWEQPSAASYEERLHAIKQVWVHVDYTGYRKAYQKLGMALIPEGYFLDHIQNREAIRLRNYSHPYLRLCPVSRHVNTSAGNDYGGEGMEKKHLKDLPNRSLEIQESVFQAMQSKIIYADPMDLTKMIDIPPGTGSLPGVRDTQNLFYP